MPGIPVFMVSEKLVFRQILAEKEGVRASSLRSLGFSVVAAAPPQKAAGRPQDARLFAFCLLRVRLCYVNRISRKKSSGIPGFYQGASREKSRLRCSCLPHERMRHTVALAFENQEMTVVNQTVNHGGCHLFICEYSSPF